MKTRVTQFNTWMSGLFVLLMVLILGVSNTQGQTILQQNFEAAAWTVPSTLSPAWSTAANATAGANGLWAASNAPTSASGWSSTNGAWFPTIAQGAAGTTKSARFHDYDCPSGGIGELYSPTMDFSSFAGEKAVSFFHINTSGTDVTRFAVSLDGGTTWGPNLVNIGVSTTWTQYIVPIGNTTASNVRIKFRADGTFGGSDIGIDEVNVFVYNPSVYNYSTTASGGLWSSPATWVGGVVPPQGIAAVTVPAGSVLTVDVASVVNTMSVSGILQWGSSNTALTTASDFTINSGGKLYAHTSASGTASMSVGGNFINNGYANLALGGNLTMNGSGSYSISGTGIFEGDGTRGIIRQLSIGNSAGSYAINTTQNLTVNAAIGHTGGALNTNGKLKYDNTAQINGLSFNNTLSNVVVTNMGSAYSSDPVVASSTATQWTSGAAGSTNSRYFNAGNIYLLTAGTTQGTVAPTHTSGSANNFLWLCSSGTLGTLYLGGQSHTAGTQYIYGDNLYLCTLTGNGSATTGPTHTSGQASVGASSFLYVGPAIKVSVNRDATTSTIRSLSVVNAGSGYASAPSISFSGGGGSGAAATSIVPYSVTGITYGFIQKSGEATITGGLDINSDQGASVLSANPQASSGVGAVFAANGGANYTIAPQVGFSGPTALNLVTNGGSGFTSAPTITVTGGTQPAGASALATGDFIITVNQGKVVSVYLNTTVTKTYITPPTLAFSGGGGSGATLAFPANCWPAATANIGTNRQITSFTVTNTGFGYVVPPTVAVGNASATVTGGTYTTAVGTLTARIAAYTFITAFYTGASGAGTQLDDAYIPTNRKMHGLHLAGNDNGIKLSGNLTLMSSGTLTTVNGANNLVPLRLVASGSSTTTAGQNGNVLDLGGNNLYFSWNGYGGTTSTQGTTNAYVKNGSITLTTRGGGTTGSTLNFPFLGTQSTGRFQVVTGTGTTAANGADILTVKVTETGAPGNSNGTGANAIAIGKRAYKVETATIGGVAGTAGTNPSVSAGYNMTLANSSPDSLYTSQDQTFLAEAATLNGAWTVRSAAVGASGALATSGVLTSATTAPGPITLASGNHYAFGTTLPTIVDVAPLSVCAASGNQVITGTNLSGVTAVSVNGVPVTSFVVVSSTQINFVAGAQTSGVVSIVKAGATISGTQTLTWTGGPSAPSVSATTATTILTGQTVSFSATGSGNPGTEIRWYDQATGGVSLGTGATFTTPGVCANKTFYATEYDGSCEGPRTPAAVTVTRPSITVSKATFCGVGGPDTLTVTPSDPAITYTWSNLNSSATFDGGVNTGTQVVANVTATAEFKVVATNGLCSDSALASVGLYPLPTANVTTTASGVCPGTSATINSGLTAGNFTATCITPVSSLSTPPASATTLILNGTAQTMPSGVSFSNNLDDGKFGPIPMGFNFNFFGATQTQVNIGTNGVVNFGSYASFSGTQYVFTGGFPNASNPANTIAVCARDLRFGTPAGFGSLRYWTEGIAPNRRFIVQYDNVPIWSGVVTTAGSQSGFNNVEAVFYETLGTIDIRVISATNGTSSTAAEINKYIGLQDATKTVGATAPNCATNVANFWNGVTNSIPATGSQAWRFAPPSNYRTIWESIVGTTVSTIIDTTNKFTLQVAPAVTTTYSITYTNLTTGCTNEPRSAEVPMEVLGANAPTGVVTLSSADSICTGGTVNLSLDYTGSLDGLTFHWQQSLDGGVTWDTIPGATAVTYTAAPTAITSYRCKIVSCGGAPEFSSAKTIYFTYFITGVTSNTRCGTGTGTLSATSNATNVRWYDAQTGGTNLGTVNSGDPFTTPTVSVTTVFWAEPRTSGCAGLRVPDTLFVNPAPAFSISSNAATICGGDTTALITIATGALDYDVVTVSPTTGVTGDAANGWRLFPSTTTTYTFSASQSAGICANSASFAVTVNPKPVIDSVGASATTVCAGETVNLTAYSSYVDAGPQTLPTGYCTVNSLGLDANSYFNAFSTTGGSTNINNSASGYSTGGFGDFTAQGVSANAGQTINFNTSLVGTTVGVAIWVDWNRNGTYESTERMYNTTGYVSTSSGSFTVPSSATPGRTRMRIMMDYNTSNPTNPCSVSSFGRAEVEEYSFYVSNVALTNPALTYTWEPGTLTGATQSVNPTSTTTYTVTATNTATGCVGTVTGSKTINVNPLPAAPSTFGGSQCGSAVPNCFATGSSNGSYRWYLSATGGSALAGEFNGQLSTYSINTTTTFYVAINDGTCESVRVPVTQTVTTPDAVTASSNLATVCADNAINLSVSQTGSTNTYTYEWTASPSSGSGISGSVSGSTATVTPTASGTIQYTVTATDAALGCVISSSVNVTVNPNPVISTLSATPSTICAGQAVALEATSVGIGAGNVVTGTGTSLTATSGYPTIFENYYYQTWQQFIYRASELTALGLGAGNITSVSFNIGALPSPLISYTDYVVSIGASTSNTATTAFQTTGLSTVYGPGNIVPVVGTNTITFVTPYNWDGVSDIVLDIKQTGQFGNANATTQFTATSYNSVRYARATSSTPGYFTSSPAATLSTSRPNMTLAGQAVTNITANYSWSWQPGALTGDSVNVTPSTTTSYEVTATDVSTGCFSKDTVDVTVNPLPPAPTANASGQCGSGIPTASVSSNSGATTPSFNWYSAATGGSPIQTGTPNTYLSSISATDSFYVAEVSEAGCIGPRSEVIVTVTEPDPILAPASDSSVCLQSSFDISATYSPLNNTYTTYVLTASPLSGSGISGPITLTDNGTGSDAYTVTPTATGTYVYTITATDDLAGCNSQRSTTVVVNGLPSITTATGTPSTLCAGDSINLSAASIGLAPGFVNLGGTGTASLSTTGSPYRSGNGTGNQIRTQLLYTAAELTAAGLGAGNITSIAFTSTAPSGVLNNFTVSIGATSATSFSGTTFSTDAVTQVVNEATYTPVDGLNVHNFTTPFAWNGTSNILINVCQTNSATLGTAGVVTYAFTGGNLHAAGSATACTATTGNTSTSKPIIRFGGITPTNITSQYVFTWNPGALTGANVRVASNTATSTYVATATDLNGCIDTAEVNVTVNPLPSAPVGTNSTQCGVGVPTASVVSGDATATPTFSWYATATGGTALQTSTSATYTSNVSATDTFYVAERTAAGCEGPRTEVIVTVNQPDTLVASSANVCLGASVNLTATVTSSANSNNYTLTWSAASAASGITGSTSGGTATFGTPAITTVTPTAAGTYVYSLVGVDGVCSAASSVTVTVNPNPIVTSVTANPDTICAGAPVTLTGASLATSNGSVTQGTGTGLSSSSSYPTIFENYWTDSWQQYIYRASELSALGLFAGNISSITFNIGALPNPVVTYTNYTVRIGASTSNTANTTFQTSGLTTVYGPGNIVPTVGNNTITFASPYNWDGVSDLVIDIRQTGAYGDGNATTRVSSTAYASVRYGYNGTSVPNATFFDSNPANAATSTSRPNMTINGVVGSNLASTYSWSWTGGFTGNPATATNTTVSTDFFGTATIPSTGCSTTFATPASVTVVPVSATASSSVTGFSCAGAPVTLTASPVGQGPFTYQWSAGATNLGTAVTQSVSPTATTTYTVTVRDFCNNPTTADVTVNVNALPTVSIQETGSPLNLCAPATQTLTAVPSTSTVTYQWMLNGTNISNANSATYTASASGTYTVKVTDTTINCTSAASTGFVLNYYPQPTAITVTPAAPSIAFGGNVALAATGGTVTINNVVALSENFDADAPLWNITNAGTGATVQPWILRTSPFTFSGNGVTFNNFSTPQGGKFPLVNAAAGGAGSSTNSTLVSPSFNTTNFTSATLSFEQVLRRQTGDVAQVQLSTDGGSTWANVANYTTNQGTTTGGAQVATTTNITLTSTYLNQANMRLRFNYTSSNGFYWLVDNVRITGTTFEAYTYNWTPSASLSAATGANVTASPSSTTTYTVSVTTQNTCSRSQDVTVTVRPTASITGTTSVCAGNTAANLSIAVNGNGPWSGTLSDGTTFSGSSSPIVVAVSPASTTTYTIATLTDASGTSQSGDLTGSATVTVNARPTGAISGTATICNGASSNLSIAVTGAGPWSGTLSDGTTFSGSSSPIVVAVSPSATTSYSIATLSDANCSSVSGDLSGSATITVNERPTGVISGSGVYCAGNATPTVLSIAVTGNGPWSGTLSNGQSFSGSSSPISVTVPIPSSSTTYTIAALSDANCSALAGDLSGSGTVSINSRPTAVISGTTQICGGQSANLTITMTGVAPFSGVYSDGTSNISFTSATSVYNFTVTPTSANTTYTMVSVTDANACGSTGGDISGSATVTVNPYQPEPVQGLGNVCPFIGTNTVITYTVPAVPGAISYNWTFGQTSASTLIQLVDASGNPITYSYANGYNTPSNVVRVKFLAGFANQLNKQIRVRVTTSCGTSAQRIFYVSAQRPGSPLPIVASSTNVCPSLGTSVPITYTIPAVSAAQEYVWAITTGGVPSTTAFITHPNGTGVNDTTIAVTFAANFSTSVLTVYAVNDCGVSPNSRSYTISRNNLTSPGLISGPTNACEYIGSTGVNATYSVPLNTLVDSYTWTLPAGATNISGQGTRTISFRYPAGFNNGTVSVFATNGCGNSITRSLSINTLNVGMPGQIDVANVSLCPNRVYTYTIASLPNNATLLKWKVPAGGTIAGAPVGSDSILTTATSITVSYVGTDINGVVSVQALNNCSFSNLRIVSVKLTACPVGGFAPNGGSPLTKGEVSPAPVSNMDVKVFPNPTTSTFNLQVVTAGREEIGVRVLDVQGRVIRTMTVMPYQSVNLGAELKAGSYLVEVRQGKSVKTTRVLKF